MGLLVLTFFIGCGEEAKTKEYYSQHMDEAKARAEACKKLEKYNEIQQLDCQNARRAIDFDPKASNPFDTKEDMRSFAKLPGWQKKALLNKNENLNRVDYFFKASTPLLFSLSTPIFAAESSTSVLNLIQSGIGSWIPTVKSACLWIFFILTIINWVWSFGLMALSGFEFNEFLATLIKKIMYVGVFLFLFNVDSWLDILLNGFSQLATNV